MRNPLWIGAGWGFLTLGIIGAFLPVMPTTCFILAALACSERGNPKFAYYLRAHPRFRPTVIAWERDRAILRKAKIIAIAPLVFAEVLVVATVTSTRLWAIVAATLVTVGFYIVSRTTAQSVIAHGTKTHCLPSSSTPKSDSPRDAMPRVSR